MGLKQTACGIFLKNGRMLLGKRFDHEDVYAGFWDIPSGHVDSGETLEEALRREMREELGVDVLEFCPAFVIKENDPTSGQPYEHNCFYVTKWRGRIKNRGEAERLSWFSKNEVRRMKCTIPPRFLDKIFREGSV